MLTLQKYMDNNIASSLTWPTGAMGTVQQIELLSKVHHKYLVSLLGFCSIRTHQIIIYEFMGGGNLRQRLQAGACKNI